MEFAKGRENEAVAIEIDEEDLENGSWKIVSDNKTDGNVVAKFGKYRVQEKLRLRVYVKGKEEKKLVSIVSYLVMEEKKGVFSKVNEIVRKHEAIGWTKDMNRERVQSKIHVKAEKKEQVLCILGDKDALKRKEKRDKAQEAYYKKYMKSDATSISGAVYLNRTIQGGF